MGEYKDTGGGDGKVRLNDGKEMPVIGYGSGTAWYAATGPDGISPALVDATRSALALGYTHLDAAKAYGNERSTGVAISSCGIPREKLFITTKISANLKTLKETLKAQLRDLQVEYVDLYLLHTPLFATRADEPSLAEAWKLMEEVRAEGLARSIGVSNYRIKDLQETLKACSVKPAVNQIELHPYVWKEAEPLLAFMEQEKIALEAYGTQVPVVKLPGGAVDGVVSRLSRARGIGAGEVLMKWAKGHGAMVVTTSGKEERMASMRRVFLDPQSDLSPAEIQELDALGRNAPVQRIFQKHMSEL